MLEMEMPTIRKILIGSILVAILAYIGMLVSGRSFRKDGYSDLGEKLNTFTLYYMNGCPHCESILPDYKNFAAAGQIVSDGTKTEIRLLEQGDPAAAPGIKTNSISGFPTFIMNTAAGENLEYKGERTIPAIKTFINSNAS